MLSMIYVFFCIYIYSFIDVLSLDIGVHVFSSDKLMITVSYL